MDQADTVKTGLAILENFLREATLALETRRPGSTDLRLGTGFLVAPGIVATCAHALAENREELPAAVTARTGTGRELQLEVVPQWYRRERAGELDLALLRVPPDAGLPHVLLGDAVETGDRVWAFGHPGGRFRGGQSALFTVQGASRLLPVDADGRPLGEKWESERLFGTPVGGGYSGSPVLSHRCGSVCGMLFSADKAGSAHMVSAADILALLRDIGLTTSDADHNTRWLRELDDDQIGVGGWRYPGPRLRAYLDAAALVAREHPYPGVVPGASTPPLTTVHLRQQAQLERPQAETNNIATPSAPRLAAPGLVLAEDVLNEDGHALVIAGPGGGKSTLLRIGLITLAERWRLGSAARWIPVMVPAAALAAQRPLSEAIAQSVKADLSQAAPQEDWPPEFFNREPLPGVRWLVLVDGLDEITDAGARKKALTKLANASAMTSSPYRFVATTRPLPESELTQPSAGDWTARRYDLLPFAIDDLRRFTEQWFTQDLGPQAASQSAGSFVNKLRQLRLEEMACTPLMATILCQLYTHDLNQPLPESRSGIYRSFTGLLYKRQRDAGLRAQTKAALKECGQHALHAAEATLNKLPELIERLAAERYAGSTVPALDFLTTQPAAKCPETVPEDEWKSFLEESLRTSGLLTIRAGEAVFLHQTLLEYLAARHATRTDEARARTFKELNRPARYRPGRAQAPGIRPRIWGRRYWQPPAEHTDSFVGFLIDSGYAKATDSPLTPFLHRLAAQGGLDGVRFVAGQVQLGTRLPDSIIRTATGTLASLVQDTTLSGDNRVRSAEALAEIDRERGHDALERLADENALKSHDRVGAASALAWLDRDRGLRILERLADETALNSSDRVDAASALAWLHRDRGIDAFKRLVRDPTLTDQAREDVARALAGRDRGHDALERLAVETVLNSSDRVDAARALAGLDRDRGLRILERLADETALTDQARKDAARALDRLRFGNMQEVAERLASAEQVLRQREWDRQRVDNPFPLAVRFRIAAPGLLDHWGSIRQAPPEADPGPLELTGRLDRTVEVFRSIPSRRLVVLGAAGSGKSILATRFVLDWLGHSTPGDPVPVIFSLGSWDPTTISLHGWMADQLVRDYIPAAPLAHGGNLAEALVDAGWILPVLDGFDEIASGLRHIALRELGHTTVSFLLTSRPGEYAEAVGGYGPAPRAAVVELSDLTVDDLAEYLPRTARPRSDGRLHSIGWEPVLSALYNEPPSTGTANLAKVLTTPLMVTLARDIYNNTSSRDPVELLDSTRFGTPESLQQHLLATMVHHRYQHGPTHHYTGRSRRHWNSGHAQHWLGYLAAHLNALETRDLEWWRLGATMNLVRRTLIIGLLAAVAIGVTTAVGNICVDLITTSHGLGFTVERGLVTGVLHGLVAGPGVGLAYRFVSRGAAEPSRVRMMISGKSREPQTFLRRFVLGLVAGLAAAFVLLFVDRGVFPGLGLHSAVVDALVFGLGTGLVLGILARLETPIDIRSAVSPVDLLSTDRRNVVLRLIVWVSVFGLGGGFATGVVAGPVHGFLGGLMFGLTAAFGGGIGYGLSFTAWGQWVALARIWLPLTGRLPWALIAFLDDACRRGVLRHAGAVYQFRHAQLQDYLATPESRTATTDSAQAPRSAFRT